MARGKAAPGLRGAWNAHGQADAGCDDARRAADGSPEYERGRMPACNGTTGNLSEQRFFEGLGLDREVEGFERFEERLHAIQGPGVRAVGEGFRGVGMGFHEETGDT